MGLLKASLTWQSKELPGRPRPSSAHIQYNTRGKAPTIRCWESRESRVAGGVLTENGGNSTGPAADR